MSTPRNTTSRASRARDAVRAVAAVAVVAVLGVAAACSDAPSSPSAAPTSLRLSKAGAGAGLTETVARETALAAPVTVSYEVVPSRSGSFELPGTGLRIDVPKGAVAAPVTITATALPGAVIAYTFQPHGLVFERPLRATQDVRVISAQARQHLGSLLSALLGGRGGSSPLEIGYFTDESAVAAGGEVSVHEFLANVLDLRGDRMEFEIPHFSGYMVAWGRKNR